uniref:Uncharacterized protein n=1 Tax=Arundo donax TaxID=35708 RepID=A0A0A9DZ46_ARUDO
MEVVWLQISARNRLKKPKSSKSCPHFTAFFVLMLIKQLCCVS